MIKKIFAVLYILILFTGCTEYRENSVDSEKKPILVTEKTNSGEQFDFPEESTAYNKIFEITDNKAAEPNSETEEISGLIKNELLNFNHIIHFDRKVDEKIVSEVCDYLSVENPELYWIAGYTWSTDGYNTDIKFNIINDFSVEELKEQSDLVEKNISEIILHIDSSWNDFDKIKYVHDYIIDNTVYDSIGADKIQQNEDGGFCSSAYGCLIEGKAVCQGYADAFKMIMDRIGIESGIVSGITERGKHAWNYVKADGEYYWIDLTWDDPVTETGDDIRRYDYFMLNNEMFMKNRVADNPERLPLCQSMKLNYFVYNNLFIDTYSFEELCSKINNSDSDSISFMFSSLYEMNRCLSEIVDEGRIWEINRAVENSDHISYGTYEKMNVFTIDFK
ncbi:MAG: hypothetical protein MSH15_03500 [Oscillospiraceae bacterium]|nr:hypothetical protein [Oscillospiraceae bacterium]